MLRPLAAFALLGALHGAAAPGVGAQPPARCTYDECSLRLEHGRLLRGRPPGEPVARVGVWTAPRLGPLVAGSDSAMAHAAVFDRHYNVGRRLYQVGVIGATSFALGSIQYHDSWRRGARPAEWALLGAGAAFAGVMVYGGERMKRGSQAFARALWWYNYDLTRQRP
jgi:hypothetical protein